MNILFGLLRVSLFLYDLCGTITGTVFRISPKGQIFLGSSVFSIGYLVFVVINLSMLIYVRKRILRRIIIGFFLTEALAVLINLTQRLHGQSSLRYRRGPDAPES